MWRGSTGCLKDACLTPSFDHSLTMMIIPPVAPSFSLPAVLIGPINALIEKPLFNVRMADESLTQWSGLIRGLNPGRNSVTCDLI